MKKTIEIKITSTAFENNGMIPARFTCDGEDVNPPLEISGVPPEAKSLSLIMHDPDAPRAGGWTHWVRFNIKTNYESGMTNNDNKVMIEEGKEPKGVAGKGTGGNLTYQGPCPPSRGQSPLRRGDVPPSGTHRYFFKIYALDREINLKSGATKEEVEKAMTGHIIGSGELIGLYQKQ